MHHTINEFIEDWKYEKDSTLKVFEKLDDNSLSFKADGVRRSIGFLAWHIVTSLSEMISRTGLKISAPEENSPQPASAKEIYDAYKQAADSLSEVILNEWNDDTLKVEDNMYGEMWAKAVTLWVLVKHQIHHRAQLTVLMRQAGLKVPGVYGPSYEEWAEMGMEPQQ
jgi:uncharacterized damage-inducible protein DinB